MENTEKLIVEQLKNGNEDAYKYIYDYHYVLLCHVANQYLNDNFLSETIVVFTNGCYSILCKQ